MAAAEGLSRHNGEHEILATLDLASVIVRDIDGTIRFWSKGCERLYGWTAEEAVGRSTHRLLRTVWPVPLAEIDAMLLRHGEWSGDLRHRRRDGVSVIVRAHKVLRRDAGGRPVAVAESVTDVTVLREAQAALRRLNDTLEARVREEIAAREEAQAEAARLQRLQALGQLAGGVAHDFNNVLQAVHSGVRLIQDRATDPEQVDRVAGLIAEMADRGATLTRRLLTFARHADLRPEPIDAETLLRGVAEMVAHAPGSAITVRVETAPHLPAFSADRRTLELVLVDLATNARDAMPEGGTLTLSAAPEVVPVHTRHPAGLPPGCYVRLACADAGHGMARDVLARASEPFFTTKPSGNGTGLSLAMARGFAEQTGGGMRIESEPGRGTTVMLWLPAGA